MQAHRRKRELSYDEEEFLESVKLSLREGDWVETSVDLAELPEDITDEELAELENEFVPRELRRLLRLAGFKCDVYATSTSRGYYVASCVNAVSGVPYEFEFSVDFDIERGMVTIVGLYGRPTR